MNQFSDQAPNREVMLSGTLSEEQRREIIVARANWLVDYADPLIPRGYPAAEWPSRGFRGMKRLEGRVEHFEREFPWTPERLYDVLQSYQRVWEEMPDRAELAHLFDFLARCDELPNIARIVCFGNGAPSGGSYFDDGGFDEEDPEFRRECEDEFLRTRYLEQTMGDERSCLQYAAALDFAALISKLTHGREIEVWVQDPFLKRVDIVALQKLGVRIANPFTYEGYTLVNEGTFVIAICVDIDAHVKAMTLESGRPAMILWTDDAAVNRGMAETSGMCNFRAESSDATADTLEILYHEYNSIGPDLSALTGYPGIYGQDDMDDTLKAPLSQSSLYILKPEFRRAPK